MEFKAQNVIKPLLAWYGKHARTLPWRENQDPYRVWLSEVMLQQTTVTAVIPYFLKFLDRYPDVTALATADNDHVMRDWAGLGYYSRARNLHACAKAVVADHGGVFPRDEKALKSLPGIGDYTAAAIMSIAFNVRAVVMDGNVDRVISRLFKIETPLPKSKPEIRAHATRIFMDDANKKPNALPQAFMDLGATICTPKKPLCVSCPLNKVCQAYASGVQTELPRRETKKKRPEKHGFVYWVNDGKGRVLTHKRPEKGLLAGMMGLPTSDWVDVTSALKHLDLFTGDHEVHGHVRHVFTHFGLKLNIIKIKHKGRTPKGHQWVEIDYLSNAGFPSLFAKVTKYLEPQRQ